LTIKVLSQFKVLCGPEVNTSKTEAMWLGKWKNKSDTPFDFNWPVEPIGALGVFFSYDARMMPPKLISLISMKSCEKWKRF